MSTYAHEKNARSWVTLTSGLGLGADAPMILFSSMRGHLSHRIGAGATLGERIRTVGRGSGRRVYMDVVTFSVLHTATTCRIVWYKWDMHPGGWSKPRAKIVATDVVY